ncbi:MAG: hypothetical protein GC160_28905 [Acidobacteria bacterium]|nr:hypothetical protein [Acidobacteriota bacterium]
MSHLIRKLPVLLAFTLVLSAAPPVAQAAPAADSAPSSEVTASQPTPQAPQLLDEQELAELQARDEQPGAEVSGGALSNQHLTYIVIALAAAVLVLVLN